MRLSHPIAASSPLLLVLWLLAACGARPTASGAAPASATDRAVHCPPTSRIQGTHAPHPAPIRVQLLSINDFHGQLTSGRTVGTRAAGGAAVLAAHLKRAQARFAGPTFIVHAGDQVGASPPESALLKDEPSIQLLNRLGNAYCSYYDRNHPRCNLVGTLGNHEFDEGVPELLRLLEGGNHNEGPFLEPWYRGATFPYVSANVINDSTGQPLLAPYVVRNVDGPNLGFIGAVLKSTPSIVTADSVAGLTFLDEAEAINTQVTELQRQGVEAIIVLVHQGAGQAPYQGPTRPTAAGPTGAIADIVSRLSGAVDVVISGHAHNFSNAFLPNKAGNPTLVTQAFASGTAFGQTELVLDRCTGHVLSASAVIKTAYADEVTPDAASAALVHAAQERVAPLVNRQIGRTQHAISRAPNQAGESALGNLIADAQRAATGTAIAFMNPGGIRADMPAGQVTWGDLFAIHPFGNNLVRMSLTGSQIMAVLEQQWQNQPHPRVLQVSGLTYAWTRDAPPGRRVLNAQLADGSPLEPAQRYSVVTNSYLATGQENFTTFAAGSEQRGGPSALQALVDHITSLPQPFTHHIEGRIQHRQNPGQVRKKARAAQETPATPAAGASGY